MKVRFYSPYFIYTFDFFNARTSKWKPPKQLKTCFWVGSGVRQPKGVSFLIQDSFFPYIVGQYREKSTCTCSRLTCYRTPLRSVCSTAKITKKTTLFLSFSRLWFENFRFKNVKTPIFFNIRALRLNSFELNYRQRFIRLQPNKRIYSRTIQNFSRFEFSNKSFSRSYLRKEFPIGEW